MVNNENKKPTMPSIEQVLNAIRQRDMFPDSSVTNTSSRVGMTLTTR